METRIRNFERVCIKWWFLLFFHLKIYLCVCGISLRVREKGFFVAIEIIFGC